MIPGTLGGEQDAAGIQQRRRHQQHHEHHHHQPKHQQVVDLATRRLGRQPGAAPSDGGLIRVVSPPTLAASLTTRKIHDRVSSGGGGGDLEKAASPSRSRLSSIFRPKRGGESATFAAAVNRRPDILPSSDNVVQDRETVAGRTTTKVQQKVVVV